MAALPGIGLQDLTETVVHAGSPTGAEVVDAGSEEGLRGHGGMAAREGRGLQHLATGVGLLAGTVPGFFAGICIQRVGTAAGPCGVGLGHLGESETCGLQEAPCSAAFWAWRGCPVCLGEGLEDKGPVERQGGAWCSW